MDPRRRAQTPGAAASRATTPGASSATPGPDASRDASEADDRMPPMGDEARFYYLRLMAKPRRKLEPITTKFVTWSRDEPDAAGPMSPKKAENVVLEVSKVVCAVLNLFSLFFE